MPSGNKSPETFSLPCTRCREAAALLQQRILEKSTQHSLIENKSIRHASSARLLARGLIVVFAATLRAQRIGLS